MKLCIENFISKLPVIIILMRVLFKILILTYLLPETRPCDTKLDQIFSSIGTVIIYASCTRANNSHVEKINYLIDNSLFKYLKLHSTSQYKMFDVINLSFSVRCRYPSVIAAATLSNEEDLKNST
jgi:hypothetical protein